MFINIPELNGSDTERWEAMKAFLTELSFRMSLDRSRLAKAEAELDALRTKIKEMETDG